MNADPKAVSHCGPIVTEPSVYGRHLTVTTPAGEQEFRDVDVFVEGGVLVIRRLGRELTWFAAGQWTEASFR